MVDVALFLTALRQAGVRQITLSLDPPSEACAASSPAPAPPASPAQASAQDAGPTWLDELDPARDTERDPEGDQVDEEAQQDDPLFWGTSLRPRKRVSEEASDG